MSLQNIFRSMSCMLVLALLPTSSFALDEKRLWLPVKYQIHYLKLKEAALQAEALERCVTVLEGTIDLEQGSGDKPIYRIQCRQANGRSYNEMVDGSTMKTLTTQTLVELVLTEEEIERQRLDAEKRVAEELVVRKEALWLMCQNKLQEHTRLMTNRLMLNESMPEPEAYTEEYAVFNLDFDAEDVQGNALHYRARCVAQVGGEVSIKIGKRPI